MCLEINYKIVFSVLVICKLYVNVYMALGKIQVSLLLFLPLSHSWLPGKLSATWPGHPRVLAPTTAPGIPFAPTSLLGLPSPRGHLRNAECRGGS